VSVIKPATLKALIESKLEMDKSELKNDFLKFVSYLEKMAIIHEEHWHVVEHKKTGDSGMKNTGKGNEAGSRSSGHNSGGSAYEGGSNKASDLDRTKSGHGRSSDATGTGKKSAREPPPCPNTKKCAGEKHYKSECPHTGRDEAIVLLPEYKKKRYADKKKANFKALGNKKRRRTTEMSRPRISRRRISGQGHGICRHRLRLLRYTSQLCGGRKEAWLSSQGRGAAGAHHAEHGYQGRKRQAEVQRTRDAHVSGDNHYAVGPLCMRGVRQIIVEEDMDHLLIGRLVLDEIGFVPSQHLDSVRDKFHLHDFSHIGEDLLEMEKQPLGVLSKLLLMPADIHEFIEDLPNGLTLVKKQEQEASGADEAKRA
jgi:hypothetical protein